MTRIILVFLYILGFFSSTKAQNGSLSGKIISDKVPVGFANISVSDSSIGTYSNVQGDYSLENLAPGEYKIVAQFVGLKPQTKSINLAPNEDLKLDFDLIPDLLNLEQVVVSGTRSAIKAHLSPIIVNQINGQTFEATQSLSLAEGLNFSPGLRVENNCQNCGFTQLRMNGLDGAYSQILINSRPVFSALAGVYGLEMLPANMVDRIEVVRGGGSALYGGNAIAGTVNIITKDPIDNRLSLGLNQSLINGEASDNTLSFNGTVVSDSLNAGVAFYGYRRQRDHWDANKDDFSEITQLKNSTFGLDAFWNNSNQSKIKLGLYSINEFRRGGSDFDLEPHQSAITEQLRHQIFGANLSYEQLSANLQHSYSGYSSIQSVNRHSYYGGGGRILSPSDVPTDEDILALNAYGQSGDVATATGGQYVYTPNVNWTLTLGAEWQYNGVKDEMPGYQRLIDQRVNNLGQYGQVQYKASEQWTFLLGGRLDVLDIKARYKLQDEELIDQRQISVFVPRLSAMYAFSDDLKWRMSYAQGYRGPQAFDEDLHIETVGGAARFVRLSPNLKTEQSTSYTSSLNYSKYFGKNQMNLVLEGFYTRLDDPFINTNPVELDNGTSVLTKSNGGGARVFGSNAEANIAFGNRWMIQSGFSVQQAQYDDEELVWTAPEDDFSRPDVKTKNILRSPNLYGYFSLVYNFKKSWALSVSGIYTGEMDLAHVTNAETEFTEIKRSAAFFENNYKLSRSIALKNECRLELFAGVQNVFNAYQTDFDRGATRDANYVYGPSRPRTYFFGLTLGFGS